MNKTKKIIKENMEEFDKEFPNEDFREDMNDGERERYFMLKGIESYLSSSQTKLIESIIEDLEEMITDYETSDYRKLAELVDGGERLKLVTDVHNKAIKEIQSNLKELLVGVK